MTENYCGATKRDGSGEECRLPAGWGTDHTGEGRCKHHGGASDGAPEGNDNSVTHGAFREHFRADLTDAEREAIDNLVDHLEDIDGPRAIAAESAAEALMKYKRSADSRFLREARQWFAEFNLIPNSDELELGGSGGGALEVVVERSAYDNESG